MQSLSGKLPGTSCIHENGTQVEVYEKSIADIPINHYPCFVVANKDKEERSMTTMDKIHHIRELFYQQGMNISEIASVTGFNWKTVKKYVDMEDFNSPPPTPEFSHDSKLDPYKPLINSWLATDKKAPRKQRHTAQRIFNRQKMRQLILTAAIIWLLCISHKRKRIFR